MWRLILWTGIFVNVILLTHGGKSKGKKVFMDWEKFVDCPDFQNKDINSENMSVFRGDVTTLSFQGSFTVETDIITPPLKLSLAIDRQMPAGGAHRMLLYEVEDFCDKILQNGSDWEPYMRALVPLPPENCPIYKQEYSVDGVHCNTDMMELRKDMVGRYTATLELSRPMEETTVAGLPPTLTKFICKILHFVIDTE